MNFEIRLHDRNDHKPYSLIVKSLGKFEKSLYLSSEHRSEILSVITFYKVAGQQLCFFFFNNKIVCALLYPSQQMTIWGMDHFLETTHWCSRN